MNSLYFQQAGALFLSFLTILLLVMTLLVIAQSASFLSLTLESGLSALVFFEFVLFQIPIQLTSLLPLCLLAASASVFSSISNAGEYAVLRAAGVEQSSFFAPAVLVGLVLAICYTPLAFEIAPWAMRSLNQIERESRELVAQNTLINPGEPTRVGSVEILVDETSGSGLSGMKLFLASDQGQEVFVSADTADFIHTSAGVSLAMVQGQIFQLRDQKPLSIQKFDEVLVDLSPLITNDSATYRGTKPEEQSLLALFGAQGISAKARRQNWEEIARRMILPFFIFLVPMWILFWQLEARRLRSHGLSIALVGPTSLVPVLILVETPSLYAGSGWGGITSFGVFVLLLSFAGPLVCLGRHLYWRHRSSIQPSAPTKTDPTQGLTA